MKHENEVKGNEESHIILQPVRCLRILSILVQYNMNRDEQDGQDIRDLPQRHEVTKNLTKKSLKNQGKSGGLEKPGNRGNQFAPKDISRIKILNYIICDTKPDTMR
jgi:hypothetical protein